LFLRYRGFGGRDLGSTGVGDCPVAGGLAFGEQAKGRFSCGVA
jgi:hypothetical protein